MKKIILEKLVLRNFKGVREKTIEFSPSETFIKGDNGTGKTTVFDGFNWLLWGKNSINQTDFEIKTLDKDNNSIHELEHEAQGFFLVDNESLVLRRVYAEKWTKKHGNEYRELTGHTTSFYVNDVPVSLAEYKKVVNDIIPDNLSRLLTDPLYFNTQLDWKQRRVILTDIVGVISDLEIAASNPEFELITEILNSGKTLEQKKAEISPKIKKQKEELKLIPARIDENDQSRPEPIDEKELTAKQSELKANISEKTDFVNSVKKQINAVHEQNRERLNKIQSLKTDIEKEKLAFNQLQNEKRTESLNKINSLKSRLEQLLSDKSFEERKIATRESDIQSLQDQNEKLKAEFNTVKSQSVEINGIPESCHECGTPYSEQYKATKSDEIKAKFNASQAEKLKKISAQATENKNTILSLGDAIKSSKNKIDGLVSLESSISKSIEEIKVPESVEFTGNEKTIKIQSEIDKLSIHGYDLSEDERVSLTETQIIVLQQELKAVEAKLQTKDQSARIDARIKELKAEQRTISQEIAQLEKIEFTIDQFIKTKMQIVEDKVNSLFIFAKFKMYDSQVNGSESPTCICMYNGVPFNDLNYAMKPNVGLDIIRTLQEFYQIKAPIFIDNRESITEILDIDSQIVNLYKVEGLNELEIN